MTFSLLYDCVTCDCDICDHPGTYVTLLSHIISHHTLCLSLKIKKIKEKDKIKLSLLFTTLTNIPISPHLS